MRALYIRYFWTARFLRIIAATTTIFQSIKES